MEVTVEQSGTCEAKVVLTVPWDEFQSHYERSLRHHGRHVRLKGFRAGKVPLPLLEKQLGEQARNESLEHFFGEAFKRAIAEQELQPVGQQQVQVDDVKVDEGQQVQATFEVSLRPTIELAEYKGLEIESELEPVLDQEIEAGLADLRRQRSKLEPVGEEGLPQGGMALCKVVWEKDGQVVLEREGLRFSPEHAPAGLEPEAFSAAMTGAKPGDVRELPLTLPDDFEQEELRGQTATCRLEINEAYRIVPPTDEEVQSLLECEDWEGVLAVARQRIGEAKAQREEARVESALLERLLKEHEFDLPERMVERQVLSREHQLREQLSEQGTEEAQIEQEVEAQRPELRRQTELGVKAFFLVQAIAEKEGVKISQSDLVEELKGIAQRNQATLEEVRDYYTKNRLIEQVGLELLERRVRQILRENARVTSPA